MKKPISRESIEYALRRAEETKFFGTIEITIKDGEVHLVKVVQTSVDDGQIFEIFKETT